LRSGDVSRAGLYRIVDFSLNPSTLGRIEVAAGFISSGVISPSGRGPHATPLKLRNYSAYLNQSLDCGFKNQE